MLERPDPGTPAPWHRAARRSPTTGELRILEHHGVTEGRVLGELAIAAARIGTYDWDITTGRLVWDAKLRALFGEPPEAPAERTIDDFRSRVHPEDRDRIATALDEAVRVTGGFDSEYRIVRPGGEVRWLAARGRVLHDVEGRPVRLLGAAYDITEQQEGEARTTRILESMPTAFFSLDRRWRFAYVNAEAERVLDSPRERLLGGDIWELFPAAVGTDFEENYREAMASGHPVAFDAYYPPPLDAWFEVRAWPGPDGLAVYFLDVTARRRAQEETERAGSRAALVARVTAELTESLDAERAVGRLAEVVVPALADWCIVTLADDDPRSGGGRGLRDIGSAHRDPGLRPVVERYAGLRIDAMRDDALLVRSYANGETVVLEHGASQVIGGMLTSAEARDLLERLAPEAVTVLPLRGRDRTVGLITLFAGSGRAPLGPEEVAVAEEVASRAGLALDNARLYRQQRQLAEGLQRALLTEPPQTDGLEIAVRYVPAGEAAQVGGDWYDAFVQRDGATVVVIGDVVGHDIVAAASMGQLRSLLRGIAVSTGAGPADLLGGVDRAMVTLGAGTIATAVVARVEHTDDGDPSGARSVRWSNAGHPPPMVLRADGTVTEATGVHADLLLGVVPDTVRTEQTLTLRPGDTLLLYTDGIVERRDLALGDGIVALREVLVELAGLDLEALCDAVLERLLTARRHDDVALVAVRVRPLDPAAASRVR